MKASAKLIRTIKATVEICAVPLSDAAAELFVEDLSGYPEDQVIASLARCRREVRGKLTTKDVIDRLDDGRPSPDEAWAIVPKCEHDSVVWTNEMAHAWSIAQPAWMDGDRAGAARAFREAYVKAVSRARDLRIQPEWTVSLGDNKQQAFNVIEAAVRNNLLSVDEALDVVPQLPHIDTRENLLLIANPRTRLTALPSGVERVKKAVSIAFGGAA